MHDIAPNPKRSNPPHPVRDVRGRLIRLDEVERLTGLKKSTIYTLMRGDGGFPCSVRLSVRAVAWREAEVLAWCADRVKADGAHV